MLRTKEFEFNRAGQITVLGPVDAQRVVKMCVMHARRKKTKKPVQWRFIPTLRD